MSAAAVGVVFLGGCSAQTEPSDDAESNASDVTSKKPASSSSGGSATSSKHGKGSAEKAPCHLDAGTPKPNCEEILASTFPDAGGWPGDSTQKLSADARQCCIDAVKPKDPNDPGLNRSQYHWSCCAALDWGSGIDGIGIACTPWGPPVPPAMKARNVRGARPPVDAWTSATVRGVA